MIIVDFLLGLELLAALCTLVFIVSLFIESPFLANIINNSLALVNSKSEQIGYTDLYFSSGIKRSLLNQNVVERKV